MILGSSFLLFVNIVLRYVFSQGIFWSDEIVIYLVIFSTFIGASLVTKDEKHLRVDIVPNLLKGKKLKYYNFIISLIGSIFSAILAMESFSIVIGMSESMRYSAAVRMPMTIPYSVIFIGFTLMAIRFLVNAKKAFDEETDNDTKN